MQEASSVLRAAVWPHGWRAASECVSALLQACKTAACAVMCVTGAGRASVQASCTHHAWSSVFPGEW